jgi:soluble lytic murein transglycosylase-like protein
MQLMPGTAQDYSVGNPFNPQENIDGGTKYLKSLMDMFNGNLRLVLAAYNAGENAVIKYGFRIPPYAETTDYVRKVLMHYSNLKGNSK